MTTLCRFTLDQPGKAKHTDELRTPSIVINKSIATVNSNRMWRRSEALGCSIRPHVKTHKTIEGALIQTNGRRSKITVSTLAEARFFGNNNFDDILYAVPITSDKLTECSTLNEGLEQFHVMVDNESQLNALEQFRSTFNSTAHLKKWSVVLMIDSGYGRDGVNPTSDSAMDLCRKLINSDHVDFFMTYTHGGNSYHASDVESIKRYSTAERDAVVTFRKKLNDVLGVDIPCSVGSTPTCSHPPTDGLDGVAEMHPGNYMLYDYMQSLIGSCSENDVACRVLTRIVGHYPSSNSLQIDMGWTGCSAQGKEEDYGKFEGESAGDDGLIIADLKQEAGTVIRRDKGEINYAKYPIGSMLKLIPWHACAACHQHDIIYVVDDSGSNIIEQWKTASYW